ncbi:hypothetical protein RUM44_011864 [Polyplax serrata]|uniref:Uncharacterized protein n=1 Tax=Polyplax serrata TaxID=468196 RepID=A0ABR1BEL9_POLSC
MTNRIELRKRLMSILEDVLISNPDIDVPACVENCLLKSYGWTVTEETDTHYNLNDFIATIEAWIIKNQISNCLKRPEYHGTERMDEVVNDFRIKFEKHMDAEKEFVKITGELVQIMERLIQGKKLCSQQFRSKCKFQESSMDVLISKIEFIEKQLLFKLFHEENACNAHLKLQENLRNELNSLKKCMNETFKTNMQYDNIKNDKNFIELLKIYKKLRDKRNRSKMIFQ